jgi:phosphate transport system substrate-binding protein
MPAIIRSMTAALRRRPLRILVSASLLAGLALFFAMTAAAQTASTLSQVAKVYVGPFTGNRGAEVIRGELLNRLRHDSAIAIVPTASQADAILKGTGDIWLKGYIGNNPRAIASNRSAVYGGYLSLTLEGGSGQPLWSYLVTPGPSLSSSIASELGSRAAKLLSAAIVQGRRAGTTAAIPTQPEATFTAGHTLKGGGATFPAPLYQEWFQSYRQLHPETQIDYQAIGSEQGINRLTAGQLDFAASDLSTLPADSSLQRFATVLGAVVPIYHLQGVDRDLRFTPELLAGIYLGKITRWNDPAIRAVNRGLSLPDAAITVIHRSDGSGTTAAFTGFLARRVPDWKAVGAGSTVAWPTGTGAEGNAGVAALVRQTQNSIGYVELTYAIQQELSFGSVRNAAGSFISASLESVAAAAQSVAGSPDPSAAIGVTTASTAYPIASFTWIVLPAPVPAGTRAALTDLLRWMLTSGQKQCSALGYAPLPKELASRELQSLSLLK